MLFALGCIYKILYWLTLDFVAFISWVADHCSSEFIFPEQNIDDDGQISKINACRK
jgi:hypothetical protein